MGRTLDPRATVERRTGDVSDPATDPDPVAARGDGRADGSRVTHFAPMTPWESVKLPSLRNVTFAAVLAVLVAAVAAGLVLRRTPVYESFGVMLIDQASIINETDNPGPITKLNALRGKYAALARTGAIAGAAAEKLGLPGSAVGPSVQVIVPAESLILYPQAQAGSRSAAREMASALMESLVEYVDGEQESAGIDPANRVVLKIVDEAGPGKQVSPLREDALTTAVFSGLVAWAVAYVALQVLTAGRRT